MKTFLVSEDELYARSIRQVMIHEGVECPLSSMLGYDQASRRLATEHADLIVAVLPVDPLRSVEALDVLGSIPRAEKTLVIAVGPAADAKLVIRALRGVVDDYVDMSDMESEMVAALAGWRKTWAQDRPAARLVAVLAPSGGAGSSTITINLAAQLAKQYKSVGLIDMKLETGDLAALLDLKPTHTLADLSKNADRLDEVLFQRALVSHPSGVQLLAAPKNLADVNLVTAEGVRQVLGLARATFPIVIADMDHSFGEEQLQVLRQADVILMALRLDFTSLKNVSRFLDHLDGLGIRRDRVRLIGNRYGQPKEVPIAKMEEALKSKLFHVIPDDPKTVNRANNNGVPVVLDAPSSSFSKGIAKLAQLLEEVLKAEASKPIEKPAPKAESTAQRRDPVVPSRLGPAFKPHTTSIQSSQSNLSSSGCRS